MLHYKQSKNLNNEKISTRINYTIYRINHHSYISTHIQQDNGNLMTKQFIRSFR